MEDTSTLTLSSLQTELPPDYIELEKRVDALKQVHQKLLSVTYVPLYILSQAIPFGALLFLSITFCTANDNLQLSIHKRSLRLPSQHPRILHRPLPHRL